MASKKKSKAEIAKKEAGVKSCQWWRASDEEGRKPHEMLDGLISTILSDQSDRYQAYKLYAEVFGQDISNYSGDFYGYSDKLSINELQNTIETLHAQIFKNHVVPAPCPAEGDYEEQFRALGFGRWIEGIIDDTKLFHEAMPVVGLDALVFGTGIAKIYSKDGELGPKICIERVCPLDCYVDRVEAKHGKPRNFYQKSQIDRWVLFEKFADDDDKALKIIDARQLDGPEETDPSEGDQLTVWEAWHLPSSPTAKDGRHVIWIRGCTLVDELWEEPTFPFLFMKFGTPLSGFWGCSAVARLMPAQKAYDKLTQRIDVAHDLLGKPLLIKRKGASLQKAHLDDDDDGISILETEQPTADIKEWNPVPITPDAYRERDSLPQRMRGSIGISGFEAQLALPQQLREASGAALERWVEAGNARHAMFHKEYERFMLDLAWAVLREACRLEKAGKDVVVLAPGSMKSTIQMLKFSEVKLDMERLKLRVMPISQLPRTFAGRVKELSVLRDRGDITQKTYLRLLELPDIDSEVDSYVSDEDIIRKNLDLMLRTGKYISPLPYDNLDMIVKFAARKIHEVRCREVEDAEDKVALLVQYIDDALELKGGIGPAPDPAAAFAAPAPPVGPDGLPLPPPGPPLPPQAPGAAVPPGPPLPPPVM